MYSIKVELAGEAFDSFIEYLSGYVIEFEVDGTTPERRTVVVDGAGRTEQSLIGLKVRAYDEARPEATGEPFVLDFDDISGITVF